LTKNTVRKIRFKASGQSTLGAVDVWYDSAVGRLNKSGRGVLLGQFQAHSRILVVFQDGTYLLSSFDLHRRYDPEGVALLEQFVPSKSLSVVYYDGKTQQYYAKRFCIVTATPDKKFSFISAAKGSRLVTATTQTAPQLSVKYCTSPKTPLQTLKYDLGRLEVKGWKAMGSRLTQHQVTKVELLS